MTRRSELFTLGFTVLGFVIYGCSNGTGLTTAGAGSNENTSKKETSADASQSGDENKRPVQAESAADQTDEDESDLSVIPPEVVSAAYLTCTVDQTETTPEAGQVHLGCTIIKENGESFPKNTAHQKWSLKDSYGADVNYTDIALPTESSFHQIYGLGKSTYESGVDPGVAIETTDKTVVPVKKKGVVRIDGKISE